MIILEAMMSDKNCQNCKCLSIYSLGVAIGMTWALGVLVIGLLAWQLEFALTWLELLSSVYIGFAPSFIGVMIGVIWGFVDGFIGGVLVAWIYNLCVRCCCKKNKSTK